MTIDIEWKTIPLFPEYEITKEGDIRALGSKVNLSVGPDGRVELNSATGTRRNRSIAYLKFITFNKVQEVLVGEPNGN